VFEDRALTIYEPGGSEIRDVWINMQLQYVESQFIYFFPIITDNQIKEDEKGGKSSSHGADRKCKQDFGREI
jgi:hypothetical protein